MDGKAIRLTYVFHNCFLLVVDGKTLLFDYPAPEMLDAGAASVVREAVRNADLYIVVSHSHGDHFSPRIVDLAASARKAHYLISKDVAKNFPALEKLSECLVAAPGRMNRLGELDVEALPSNDLGVAYCLRVAGVSIYYGGDLANWNWDGDDEDLRLEAFFRKNLQKLAGQTFDIAFSNADARLKNWSGAQEIMDEVRPRIFVPMHTFGKTQSLKRFAKDVSSGDTLVWLYDRPGDILETVIEGRSAE